MNRTAHLFNVVIAQAKAGRGRRFGPANAITAPIRVVVSVDSDLLRRAVAAAVIKDAATIRANLSGARL